MKHPLLAIPEAYHRGEHLGITAVCSAHPLVIEAALRLAGSGDRTVLIEATCNQVNQDGGYTGMTPAAFREFVEGIAGKVGFDTGRIVLGGDHLGPNPWKGLPADEAMAKAEADDRGLRASWLHQAASGHVYRMQGGACRSRRRGNGRTRRPTGGRRRTGQGCAASALCHRD